MAIAKSPIAKPHQPIYLTADLPGIGGVIRERPEDFLVEEQPLYEPCGEGEHLYLFIEKKQLNTMDVVRRVAKAFRVGKRNVGHAGLKDKHAVTRQHLSVWLPGTPDAQIQEGMRLLEKVPGLTVLWMDRHTNKLRRGHHGGNRFSIRIRRVDPTAVIRAKPIFDALAEKGIPNHFGRQRFGFRNNTHWLGKHLLKGDYDAFLEELLARGDASEHETLKQARAAYNAGDLDTAMKLWPKSLRADRQAIDALQQGKSPRDVANAIGREERMFYLSALQSAIFNDVLRARLDAGTFDCLLPGDLAWKHVNRSVFSVDEVTAEKENAAGGRVPAFEVSPSGPSWATDMTRPEGEPLSIEQNALHAAGVTLEELDGPAGDHLRAEGSRRPLRVQLASPEISGGVDEHGGYVKVAFQLPRGAFATTVLGEIMKTPDLA